MADKHLRSSTNDKIVVQHHPDYFLLVVITNAFSRYKTNNKHQIALAHVLLAALSVRESVL